MDWGLGTNKKKWCHFTQRSPLGKIVWDAGTRCKIENSNLFRKALCFVSLFLNASDQRNSIFWNDIKNCLKFFYTLFFCKKDESFIEGSDLSESARAGSLAKVLITLQCFESFIECHTTVSGTTASKFHVNSSLRLPSKLHGYD